MMSSRLFVIFAMLSFLISSIQAGSKPKSMMKRHTKITEYQFNWGSTPNFPRTCSSNVQFNAQEFVDLHNEARKSVGAGNIEWDQGISNFAQCWANRCIFEHSHKDRLGENIAAGSGPYQDSMAVQEWWEEYKMYKDGMGFTEDTGHFTQMAWQGTQKVGCGVANCPSHQLGLGGTFTMARFVVCDYFPPGNVIGYFDGEVSLPRYDCFAGKGGSDYDDQGSSDYGGNNDQPNDQSDYNGSGDGSQGDSNNQPNSYSYNFTYTYPSGVSQGGSSSNTGTQGSTTVVQANDLPKPMTTNNDASTPTKPHTKGGRKHKHKNMKKLKCKAKSHKHKKKKGPARN